MTNTINPIGIFDSGMGGISVLKEAKKILPGESFIYFGDGANIPYGTKTVDELILLSDTICKMFIEKYSVKAIVIACNTATSAAVRTLRKKYDIPIIGMEPALKPAVKAHYGGMIGVLATPVTLREDKFKRLSSLYNETTTVVNLPAPNLVELVERGIVRGPEAIKEIEIALGNHKSKVDALVLGCTHFVFLRRVIQELFGDSVEVYDGNSGTIKNLRNTLKARNLLSNCENGSIIILNSGGNRLVDQSWTLYNL